MQSPAAPLQSRQLLDPAYIPMPQRWTLLWPVNSKHQQRDRTHVTVLAFLSGLPQLLSRIQEPGTRLDSLSHEL